ncbi:hypothetical protein PG995_003772 [Apiospora arundinis]|uniref:Uncharacterized protein n=1 Tax=Apiospora arundinis TaxID=335852 RepID=A0ABR2HRY5_9PEZI
MGDINTDMLEGIPGFAVDLKSSREEETEGEQERLAEVVADESQGERPREIKPGTQSEGGSHGSDAGLACL